MTSVHLPTGTDPVSRAILHSPLAHGIHPVPLIATRYDICIAGGLAVVAVERRFKNDEDKSIEATLTFPVPVHAVLYGLEAKIGQRLLKAIAKPRKAARETYESAIELGKTTVLHEELIRGVHMLSVGHLPGGAEIAVTARFAIALSNVSGRLLLRLPTTVGDIYGASGFTECDDLQHGGALATADITVRSKDGQTMLLNGAPISGGTLTAPLDRPIVVEVNGWALETLKGRAADGRAVLLKIEPSKGDDAAIDAAIVIDRSGSMGELCAVGSTMTKHAALRAGLVETATYLRPEDTLHLWEFDTITTDLGKANGSDFRALVAKLSDPRDGTEIEGALQTVLAARARDIILITDGKSHALDVQRLARSGARFSVVLIGEDSLEANVGHLAALSGGEIFVPDGTAIAGAVVSVLQSVRQKAGDPREAQLRRSGMHMSARWTKADGDEPADANMSRAISAYGASLTLMQLSEADATARAEAEGLCTHLTSLVLVDETGETQPGLPATRKVALPSPATAHVMASRALGAASRSGSMAKRLIDRPSAASYSCGRATRMDVTPRASCSAPPKASIDDRCAELESRFLKSTSIPSLPHEAEQKRPRAEQIDLRPALEAIDWARLADRLAVGDTSRLPIKVVALIGKAAALKRVRKTALQLGLPPALLVIGLLARSAAGKDHHAARVQQAILGKHQGRDFAALSARLHCC